MAIQMSPFISCVWELGSKPILPLFTLRELACLKLTCKVFHKIVSTDPLSYERLAFVRNRSDWSTKQIFLAPPCSQNTGPTDSICSLQTLLEGAVWLRVAGNQHRVMLCASGLLQWKPLFPTDYVRAIFNGAQSDPTRPPPERIFYHLCKEQKSHEMARLEGEGGSSEGVLDIDLEDGKKAFFEADRATDAQRAEALELYVQECFVEFIDREHSDPGA